MHEKISMSDFGCLSVLIGVVIEMIPLKKLSDLDLEKSMLVQSLLPVNPILYILLGTWFIAIVTTWDALPTQWVPMVTVVI